MYRKLEEREHPWTIQEFDTDRNEQFNCASEIVTALDYNTNVLVKAPVKSGKRQIAEIVALIYGQKDPLNKHYFITALNRLDTKSQIEELSKYNLDVVVLGVQKDSRNLIQKLTAAQNPNNIVVHFDESDYGTGIKNLFAKVFEICKKRRIKLVCYSATNEEAENSGFADVAKVIEMTPNALYKGAKWFLDNDLVKDPEAFYDGENITDHGKEIIDWWLAQTDKPIAILRLTGGEKDKGLYNSFRRSSKKSLLTKNNIECVFVDGFNGFDWMDEYKNLLESFEENGTRTLLVINQTCTRSTELGFHKHLAFLHDYRPNESNYSTLAQAYLRVAHYHPQGHKIVVYGEKEVFQLAAGLITKEEFSGKLSSRMNKRTVKTGKLLKEEWHYFRLEEPLSIVGLTLEQQKEKITEIWENQIKEANDKFSSTVLEKWNEKISTKLLFKTDEKTNKLIEFNNKSMGMGGNNGITTKRHLFRYKNKNEILVETIFHDGERNETEKDITSHKTSDKSVFQT